MHANYLERFDNFFFINLSPGLIWFANIFVVHLHYTTAFFPCLLKSNLTMIGGNGLLGSYLPVVRGITLQFFAHPSILSHPNICGAHI